MLLFMIKKVFFDMWDNLYRIILFNLGFILGLALMAYLPVLLKFNMILAVSVFIVAYIINHLYLAVISLMTRDISDYTSSGFSDFISYFKKSWKIGLFFMIMISTLVPLLLFALVYWYSLHNAIGIAIASFIFWVAMAIFLSLQYFYPVYGRLSTEIKKNLKKCLLIFFDNPGFSIYLAFGSLIILILTIVTLGLIPGISGILLWLNTGLKLRLLKYDYLEQNPNAHRKQIPWDTLLIEEREYIGKRTLKSMIFPWKND